MKLLSASVYKKISVAVIAAIMTAGLLTKFSTSVKSVEASTPCVVTLFGVQYDVTPLGTTHPGPKGTTLIDLGGSTFFQCGGDMTSIYQSMHGTDVTRMASYLYVPPTTTPTSVPTVIPTTTPDVTPTTVPTSTPSPVPSATPEPSITPSPIPSTTPAPSVSPTSHHEDDENEANEVEEIETHNTNNVQHHEEKKDNHGQEVRTVARDNNGSHHESD